MAELMKKTNGGWELCDSNGNVILSIVMGEARSDFFYLATPIYNSDIEHTLHIHSILENFADRISQLETCLRGDTKILMADGTQKDLKDVKYGDMVMGWDIDNNCGIAVKSYGAFTTGKDNNWQFHVFDNGNILEISNAHGIYSKTKGRCSLSKAWKLGEVGIGVNGEDVTLAFVDKIGESAYTDKYTMVTENNTYFANGILCANNPSSKMRYYSMGLNCLNKNITKEDVEFFKLTAEQSDESEKLRVSNREYLKESAPMYARLNIAKRKIGDYKKKLSEGDYKTIKYSEGRLSYNEFDVHCQESQAYRDKISEQENIRDNLIADIAYAKQRHSTVTSEDPSVRWKRLYDIDMAYIRSKRK